MKIYPLIRIGRLRVSLFRATPSKTDPRRFWCYAEGTFAEQRALFSITLSERLLYRTLTVTAGSFKCAIWNGEPKKRKATPTPLPQ